jgi:hypothetical protein
MRQAGRSYTRFKDPIKITCRKTPENTEALDTTVTVLRHERQALTLRGGYFPPVDPQEIAREDAKPRRGHSGPYDADRLARLLSHVVQFVA